MTVLSWIGLEFAIVLVFHGTNAMTKRSENVELGGNSPMQKVRDPENKFLSEKESLVLRMWIQKWK